MRETTCTTRDYEGLSAENLQDMNTCLISKWWWKSTYESSKQYTWKNAAKSLSVNYKMGKAEPEFVIYLEKIST